MREPWYLKGVREKSSFNWTPEMRVAVYTMRVNYEMPIDEIRTQVGQMIGKTPNRSRIHNLVRMMRKCMTKKCHRCGKPMPWSKKPAGTWLVCKKCRKEHSEFKKKIRKERIERGICSVCGKHPKVNGFRACRSCLSETYRRRLGKNLCGYCGKRPRVSKSIALCSVCQEINRIKSAINRKERIHA